MNYPSEISEKLRNDVVIELDPRKRSSLGQFMTPSSTSEFMASLFTNLDLPEIRLLDPGSGMASLSSAFTNEVIKREAKPGKIYYSCFEVDEALAQPSLQALEKGSDIFNREKLSFSFDLHNTDFVLSECERLSNQMFLEKEPSIKYTNVITNPPYKKIRNDSDHRKALRSIGIETGNLYSAFMAISILMLEENGEIVAIIPRSFCNGLYFKSFREMLHKSISIKSIHLFHSRTKAFKQDKVLQENIIIHGIKGGVKSKINITSSDGLDFNNIHTRETEYSNVIDDNDKELFIRIISTEEEQNILDKLKPLKHSLVDLDLEVMTGQVVGFRSREHLIKEGVKYDVPLLYPINLSDGKISWPLANCKKPQSIIYNDSTYKNILPNGYYVTIKRFSSKEEKRRIVSALLKPQDIDSDLVGFENKLNVIHFKKKGLEKEVATGLSVFLNSTIFDKAFRVFSGHTQVNATDLRSMKYPSKSQLIEIANVIGEVTSDQEKVDSVIKEVLLIDVNN